MSWDSKTYQKKGNLSIKRKKYELANQYYERAKEHAQRDLISSCVGIARSYRIAKKYGKALDELYSLLALFPNSSSAYNELGNLCMTLAKTNDIPEGVEYKFYKIDAQYCSSDEETSHFHVIFFAHTIHNNYKQTRESRSTAPSNNRRKVWLTSFSNWLFYFTSRMYSKALSLDNENISAHVNNIILRNSGLSKSITFDDNGFSKIMKLLNKKYKKSKRTQYEPRKILTILHYLRAISRINVNVFCYVDECLSDGSVLRVKYTIGEDCVKCKHYKACELQKYNIPAIVDDFDYAMKYDIDKVYTDKILYACGLAYLYHERYSDAINSFSDVIESSNADESIKLYSYFYRGLAYAILQDNDNCIKDFTSFIDNKKNADIYTYFDAYLLMYAHYYKGLKLLEQKNARFALADFMKVTELYWDYIKKSNKNLNTSLEFKHNKYLTHMKLITIKSCANIINIYTNHYINSKEKCVRYINSAKNLSGDNSFNYKGYSFDLILFVDFRMIDGMLHILRYEALDDVIGTTF